MSLSISTNDLISLGLIYRVHLRMLYRRKGFWVIRAMPELRCVFCFDVFPKQVELSDRFCAISNSHFLGFDYELSLIASLGRLPLGRMGSHLEPICIMAGSPKSRTFFSAKGGTTVLISLRKPSFKGNGIL